MDKNTFRTTVYNYYKSNKRSFPWRETTDPYAILISEFMLQQTQTDRVVPKYEAFIKRFPDFRTLAQAKQTEVLEYWQGLGYNRRALYLHKTAQQIHELFHDQLPTDQLTLQTFPGIGPYTAAAIIAFAFNQPAVVIETNIRTVFIYHFFGDKEDVHDKEILSLIKETVDTANPREWYYALMDYGVYLKKLHPNPNRKSKHYTKQSKFEGSDRQLRGELLRILLNDKEIPLSKLSVDLQEDTKRLDKIATSLAQDGFITLSDGNLTLKE